MKHFITFLIILTALVVYLDFRGYVYETNPDPNHIHADFAIYIQGEKIDFAQEKYMSGVATHHHDYLHLHDEIGYVLHRHKTGLSFEEFLESLGFSMKGLCMDLDDGRSVCSTGLEGNDWRMFINGSERDPDTSYAFEDMDKILLTYGSSEEEVQKQLKKMTTDACLYSKTCPWRGDPPAENCIADPEVPCSVPLGDL